ncbi:uncharacterized protein LOC119830934 [Zerene cesonia]|uniref:uncharacterized protein LOC119830934 n=1 Tax=Zerene cesonia TaxID=33412 RepID=UPI0018E4EBA3|nr:uncharacterized protein LOC119830934 [Zerene cesonia]
MENNQCPSKNKLFIPEEKLTQEIDYDSVGSSRTPKKQLFLEILQKGSTFRNSSQKVLVSIKPKAPAIKTLYIAEKTRFQSKKRSTKSGSRLAIGDHSSFTSQSSSVPCSPELQKHINKSARNIQDSSIAISTCVTSSTSRDVKIYNTRKRSSETCYLYTYPHMTINTPKLDTVTENSKNCSNKADIGTFIATHTSSDCTISPSITDIKNIHQRLDYLEKKILKQEMVIKTLDLNAQLSSSDDEINNEKSKSFTCTGQPGCSYVEYSHIPETSAFQRYAQQPAPLSPSKATTIQKEHNSEQYGRDFTLYDGITARGRRQCASVPCKRDDIPKIAAERVHRIRHKLNPVRDYRLMDTVHYLAQGEFAPRDDGIKLTPSREAVLSDIIWEDVCRTHWPSTRLGRRIAHPERYGTRSELQRLIDSLLRERVAHVERRRRRHYRIVKLNNRHENCRPAVGKTGDIIVASNKNRRENEERDAAATSDHENARAVMTERRFEERNSRRDHKSQDRLMYHDTRSQRPYNQDDCTPGPSYAVRSSNKQSTCCYRSSSPTNRKNIQVNHEHYNRQTSGSSIIMSKVRPKHPRLVVKKSSGRRKYQSKEPNLEHYILLPTLVIRTPSNMKRQKRFNELYHRILNGQLKNDQPDVKSENASGRSSSLNKKDIGLNINITLSESEEKLHNK